MAAISFCREGEFERFFYALPAGESNRAGETTIPEAVAERCYGGLLAVEKIVEVVMDIIVFEAPGLIVDLAVLVDELHPLGPVTPGVAPRARFDRIWRPLLKKSRK
jgi:hypothetical protein